MTTILFNDHESYDLDWLSDPTNSKAQTILSRHYHSRIRPKCACLRDGRSRDLTIKKRLRFFIAKLAGTGEHHALWCEFYGATMHNVSSGGKLPAIIQSGDMLNINLSSYLNLSTTNTRSSNNQPTSGGSGRNSISLLGTMNFCLEKGRLTTWYPNRQFLRTLNTLQKSIGTVAEQITIGKRRLANMLVMPIWRKEMDREKNLERNQQELFRKTAKIGQAAIVIGEVNRWIPSKEDDGYIGVGLDMLDKLLWIPKEIAEATEHSFGQLIKEIDLKDRRILAIVTVFRHGNHYTIGEIALLRTNTQFIPVDSSYELLVADQLIAQNRKFLKPIHLEGEIFLPDFILQDCQTDVVMEVFGIQGNAEYDEQKTKKTMYYRENHIPCWHWTPALEKDMPDFPKIELR